MNEDIKVKSLLKTLNILECFTPERPELGITEISEQLGLYKSNVHNILSTLMQCGYVEQNPVTNKYRLGLKILELAYVISSQLGLNRIVAPFMAELSREVGEVVYFGVPNNGQVVYLEAAYPGPFYPMRSMMGETAEMYCTAIGKAILAFLPSDKAEPALTLQSMKRYTAHTITERQMLTEELEAIRKQGYSIDNMEHEFGIRCVGAPVFNRAGILVGGLSISGPSLRFDGNTVEIYSQKLHMVASQITARLQ